MRYLIPYNNINEGGKAFTGTRSIKQSEVESTLLDIKTTIFKLLKINEEDIIVIGSAGKKAGADELSGDIDIGIHVKALRIGRDGAEKLLYTKLKTLPYQVRLMAGLDIVTTAWPITGGGDDNYVQCDFILVDNLEWAKFALYCPDYKKNESKYKSAHRNWLIAAVCSVIKFNIMSGGAGYDTYVYKWNEGLFKFKKTFIGKKGFLKHPTIVKRDLVTENPKEFIKLVFGEGINEKDLNTFESVLHIIKDKNFKHYDKLEEILKNAKEFISKANLIMPNELN